MRISDARRVAFEILWKLEQKEANSSILLQRYLSGVADPRERHLITDLVLGILRWRGHLIYLIESFSRRPSPQIDPKVFLILQLGIYQLVHSDIPQHAAIYETVKLCKKVRLSSAASFVNGILRAVQSQLSSLPEPAESDPAPWLAVRFSHPEWLVKRWLQRFGKEETEDLLQTNNEPPPLFLRLNELKTGLTSLRSGPHITGTEARSTERKSEICNQTVTYRLEQEGVRVRSTEFGPQVLMVMEGAPQLSTSFLEGEFYIQDAGVEKLGEMIRPESGSKVLEIAAAPGGKTLQLAIRMQDRGLIVAVDSELRRMQSWRRNIERLQIHCAVPVVADARALPLQGKFQQVVVDAPCSSLGVIRRHPEIKWWRNPEEIGSFSTLQLQILDSCAKYVGEQGELIYSVCSFEPEETLEVMEKFLASHTDFTAEKHLYLYPHRDQTDGFFIAKLKRKK